MKWWQIQEKNFCSFMIFFFPSFILFLEKLFKKNEYKSGVKKALDNNEFIIDILAKNFDLLCMMAPFWLFLFAVPVNLWIRRRYSYKRFIAFLKAGLILALMAGVISLALVPVIYLQFTLDIFLLWLGLRTLKIIKIVVEDIEMKGAEE